MIHSIKELYRVEGSTKLLTPEAADILRPKYKIYKALSKQHNGDAVTVYDVDGTKTIYMFGEKTWFDTQEELNEYRAQYRAEMDMLKKRRQVLNAIIAELDKMSTDELQIILEDMVGVE